MSGRFDNKVIVVTGGASGMGTTHARAFVAEGGRVVFGDVNDEAGTALEAELGANAR